MNTSNLLTSLLPWTLLMLCGDALPAQEPGDQPGTPRTTTQGREERRIERLIVALHAYSESAASGKARLTASFAIGTEHPIFGRETLPGGLLYVRPEVDRPPSTSRVGRRKSKRRGNTSQQTIRRTNRWALQRLLDQAEKAPSVAVARAVLPIAAIGLNSSLYDTNVLQVKELGHWTLMRMDDSAVWVFLTRIAVDGVLGSVLGEVLDGVSWLRRDEDEEKAATHNPALRVAALRLLGQRNRSVFRPIVETGLAAADPRVRLAAAEALYRMGRQPSFPVLVRALASERHGVVAQALLHAIARMLRKHGGRLSQTDRDRAIRACLHLLGKSEWRVQMNAVDLIGEYPMKGSVPALIAVMKRQDADLLKDTVNRNASPFLQRKAWEALKKITGVKLPLDVKVWEQFWARHKDNLKIVDLRFLNQLPRKPRRTKATFYGIPVEGGEIAFVIDTSGSMKERVTGVVERVYKGKYRRTSTSRSRKRLTRLDHAKAQLQTAVHTMDPRARYHLYTFASGVTRWSRRAVRPHKDSFRALTAVLGKIEPGGGTNMYAALIEVLDAVNLKFGEHPKSAIDEIFVLSDGEVGNTEEVLEVVKEINRYSQVKINTVFTGKGKGAEFLRQLAEQNNGTFVQK
ncbi:MAG: HEAT repeat domain-containing protein [Planctomycetota bacterium]|jgi:HEAT repeat protein